MMERGDKMTSISSFDARHAKIKQLLTCPICKKLLREVTTIDECLHTFCRKCITERINQERLRTCPVCQVDLGVSPLQKLRADYRWQSIRNSVKFKRQQFIECGLIKRKGKKLQVSEEGKELEVLPSNSFPIGRREKSPIRRKEKSISSVLRAERTFNRHASTASTSGKRKLGGSKSNPSRRTSVSNVPPITEKEDHHASPKDSIKLGNGQQGKKQAIKLLNQDMLAKKKGRGTEPQKGIRGFLKPLDSIEGGTRTSQANRVNMLQLTPSEAYGNIENKDKGKSKEETDNSRGQYDGARTISVPSRLGRSRNENRAQEKRPIVTEDLNLPVQVFLDASSSKCFRSNHIWLSLVASNKQQSYEPLPPMPSYYLTVKDPNMPTYFLRRYLMKKLRLHSEDEVELSVCGKQISPDCPLEKMVDLWMQKTKGDEKKTGLVGGSAEDFVMVVTYGRSTHFPNSDA